MLILTKSESLQPIAPRVLNLSESLCQVYPEIVLPETLVLRYLKNPKKTPKHLTLAYFGVNGGQHYLALKDTLADQRLDEVLRHEVAHIGTIGLTGEWKHNKLFWEMVDILNNQRGEIVLLDLTVSCIAWFWVFVLFLKVLKLLL